MENKTTMLNQILLKLIVSVAITNLIINAHGGLVQLIIQRCVDERFFVENSINLLSSINIQQDTMVIYVSLANIYAGANG
jgi:glycopeptide antibiotics resistance protein